MARALNQRNRVAKASALCVLKKEDKKKGEHDERIRKGGIFEAIGYFCT